MEVSLRGTYRFGGGASPKSLLSLVARLRARRRWAVDIRSVGISSTVGEAGAEGMDGAMEAGLEAVLSSFGLRKRADHFSGVRSVIADELDMARESGGYAWAGSSSLCGLGEASMPGEIGPPSRR